MRPPLRRAIMFDEAIAYSQAADAAVPELELPDRMRAIPPERLGKGSSNGAHTVRLDEKEYHALKELAAQQQVSMAELIRRAVRNLLETSTWIPKEERRRRAIAAAGRFESGLSDLAEKHD
jgi:predicted transcriptional regulator